MWYCSYLTLSILFWATCNDIMFEFFGSFSFNLTLLHSCRPYLRRDIQRLCTTLMIFWWGICAAILLIEKVLWFKEFRVILKFSFQPRVSSMVTPSRLVCVDLFTRLSPTLIAISSSCLLVAVFFMFSSMKTVLFLLATSPLKKICTGYIWIT